MSIDDNNSTDQHGVRSTLSSRRPSASGSGSSSAPTSGANKSKTDDGHSDDTVNVAASFTSAGETRASSNQSRIIRRVQTVRSTGNETTSVGNTANTSLISYKKNQSQLRRRGDSTSIGRHATELGYKTSDLSQSATESSRIFFAPERLRHLRFRTALRLVVPMSLSIIFAIIVIGLLLVRSCSQMMLNEIVRSGVMKTTSLVALGSNIIQQSVVDNDWPVRLNLISRDEFNRLREREGVSDQPETEKTTYVARHGDLLKKFFVITSNDSKVTLPVQLAYIYSFLPSADATEPLVMYDVDGIERRVLIIPDNAWLPWGTKLTHPTIAYFSPICDIWPGVLTRGDNGGNDHQAALLFRMRINTTDDRALSDGSLRTIGYVVLAINAKEILAITQKIRNSTIIVAITSLLLAIIVCFWIGFSTMQNAQVLLMDMEKIAAGNLQHISTIDSDDVIGALSEQFNRMVENLAKAQDNEKKINAIAVELDVAREIQMKLLPERLPKIRGYDVYADYKPAKEVGGDYYDFFPINRTHVGIIVADVSGKGVPACVIMATTRTILRFVAVGNTSSADTLKRVNAMLAADIRRGMFVTAYYLILNVLTREITCSSAGHNPMVIVRADGTCEKINPKGIALGFDKGRIFDRMIEERVTRLESNDRVVLYTDGVVEAMNLLNEEYTDERFYRFAMKNFRLDSEEFTNQLLADLDSHRHRRDTRKNIAEQHDDITVVTFNVL